MEHYGQSFSGTTTVDEAVFGSVWWRTCSMCERLHMQHESIDIKHDGQSTHTRNTETVSRIHFCLAKAVSVN